jgi:ornithine decarboxylase
MSLHKLAEQHPTPFLAMSSGIIKEKYDQLMKTLPIKGIYFAVKSNPDSAVLRAISALGAKFEIASIYELQTLSKIGIDAAEVLFSNPVKPTAAIKQAYEAGVRAFAVDSFNEIEKVASAAPGSSVYIRLLVNDFSSKIPLSKKFGLHASEAVEAATYIRDRGLVPTGLTFHVGSQSSSSDLWDFALQVCGKVMREMEEVDIKIQTINIGGGFPVHYREQVPDLEDISAVITHAMDEYLPYRVAIIAEPGRYMVAQAGTLVTSVIGRSVRNGKNWLYTDTSAFHGLLETMPCQGQIQYPIKTLASSVVADEQSGDFTLTGPTCDYLDTYASEVILPLSIAEGDKLAISATGAYTVSFASFFNGFPPPKVYLYD